MVETISGRSNKNHQSNYYILNQRKVAGLAKHHQHIDDTKKSLIKSRPKNTVVSLKPTKTTLYSLRMSSLSLTC